MIANHHTTQRYLNCNSLLAEAIRSVSVLFTRCKAMWSLVVVGGGGATPADRRVLMIVLNSSFCGEVNQTQLKVEL